ncbi:DUF2857 domain-containing protein [Citrobacter portucalensis]|uniref:DUF2857 domain-containing protein n=1 Tax=Citrobacter portucalensis TaxID=1639133 RepID=UPI00226B335B|nr:DUF2857 domain-containing protein [Citrobacter portucalensis]MCX8984278.1 DUF2857 domain-containing protein [Citrobacter portucalensis]
MLPSLNYFILLEALLALKEGNIRYCEALGFTYDELNFINQISLDELFVISRAAAQFLVITINHDVLRKLLAQSRQEINLQQQMKRAIQLGGSIELLGTFFGLSSGEISARRRLLGINISQGRTQIPDEETDAQIWRLWQKSHPENTNSLAALDVMMGITEKLSSQDEAPSLTVVWNRIMQCEKELSSGGA